MNNEIEMRANFYQKLDECLGQEIKTRDEYIEQCRHEIEERNKVMVDFFKSLVPINKAEK